MHAIFLLLKNRNIPDIILFFHIAQNAIEKAKKLKALQSLLKIEMILFKIAASSCQFKINYFLCHLLFITASGKMDQFSINDGAAFRIKTLHLKRSKNTE